MTEADQLRAKAHHYHEHARTTLSPWSKCLLAAIGDEYLDRAKELEAATTGTQDEKADQTQAA
jgi:hypothetical protein